MSRNWKRSCALTLSGAKGSHTIRGGGPGQLRIRFAVEMWSGQSTNMGSFRVTNISQDTATALKAKEFTQVEFAAGYEGNIGTIFKGELRQFISGHESATDTYCDLFCADGERAYNKGQVNTSLGAGYTPRDKLNAAISAMAPYGVRLGMMNVDLSGPRYPRGIPLIGMARDVIREIAFAAGATWSIQYGEVRLIDYRKPIQPGDLVEMNGRTGMVGWPRQTPDGILVSSLLNPRLQPHVNLRINPASINQAQQDNNPLSEGSAQNFWLNQQNVEAGIYNIYKIDRHGDTHGQDWTDDSTCIGQGGELPPQARANRYFLGTS